MEYSFLCYPVGPCCLSIPYITESASTSPKLPIPPPPHPTPLATTSLFSMSMSLFLFCRYVHLCQISKPIYKCYLMVFVFLFSYFLNYESTITHL